LTHSRALSPRNYLEGLGFRVQGYLEVGQDARLQQHAPIYPLLEPPVTALAQDALTPNAIYSALHLDSRRYSHVSAHSR
jgi:hypothetical protein